MLTRIISGAVMIVIVVAVLLLNTVNPVITIGFLAILAGIAVYEILNNTGIVPKKTVSIGAAVYAALYVLFNFYLNSYTVVLVTAFVLCTTVCALIFHKDFKVNAISAAIAFPIMISVAFCSIYTLFGGYGLPYFLLMLNFSSVCDCGAYFVGVALGRHKLCPEISPKKTVEGAIGGMVSSIIVTVIIALCFSLTEKLIPLLIITPVLCAVGMVGDLFASVIKRNTGIKDYGNLIPGHGGILDRFDSILLIAPVFVQLLKIMEAV